MNFLNLYNLYKNFILNIGHINEIKQYFTEKNKCFDCNLENPENFYSFTSSGDPEVITCNELTNNDNDYKLIYNTKELVTNCPDNYYLLGSICYQNMPNNAKLIEDNKYECIYSFTKKIENNLEYINCLNKGQSCPSEFDHRTINQDNNNIICSTECFSEVENKVYKYKEKDEQGKIFYYCLSTQCSSTVKYYYENEDSNIIECQENCNSLQSGGFYNGDKCVGNDQPCNGYIKVDLNKNNFECIETTTISCPVDYPYLYTNNVKNYCLKNCLDTQKINFFENVKTYLYEDQSSKNCLLPDNNLYIDELALKLTDDCKNSLSGPYHNETDHTCYKSCDNYKYESACVSICDGVLLTDEETKTCYIKCPSNLGRGFKHETERKCQSCNPGEGYYKEEEEKKCYSSCDDYYHNDGDNFCFEGECTNNLLYKYHTLSEKICYKSCSDIRVESDAEIVPKTYTYPYLFEKNNICYKEDPGIDDTYKYYYLTSSNIKKYIKENEIVKECFEANLKYLKENQCISQCNTDDFIILPTQSQLGQCLTLDEVQNNDKCKYYNDTKICNDECKFLEMKKQDGATSPILSENCVINCPSDYYENVDSKTCEKSCNSDNPYFNKLGKCVSKCENGFYKEISDTTNGNIEKKCVDKCRDNDDNKFWYYLEDGKCVDTCNSDGNTNQFSYETINDHQPCISKCPNDKPFYNTQKKICLEKCEYYQDGLCVDKCDTTSDYKYLLPGNICSTESCPSNAPFKISFNFNLEGTESQITKCVSSCTENNYALYNENKECTNNCDYDYVTYNGACLVNCPQGLYKSGDKCVSKCEKNFYKPDSSDTYECIDGCNFEPFIFTTLSGECKKKCPIGENYIDENNNCINNNTNKYFEDISVESDEYKIYKIIDDCSSSGTNKLHIYGQKECISDCNKYNLYQVDNNICNNTCFYNSVKRFSTVEEIEGNYKKVCKNQCHGSQPNFEEDLICKEGCNSYTANIINDKDNSCVNQCNINSTYKFLQKKSDDTLHCQEQCDETEYRYFNYKCSESCDSINNFIVENTKECLSKCPKDTPYYRKKIISSEGDLEKFEYECSNTECRSEGSNKEYYYYLNDKMCIDECNDYIKENTNICTKTCDDFNDQKYFYESTTEKLCISNCTLKDKPYTLMNNTCVESCNNGEFYNEYDKICRIKCPIMQKIDGNICRENCSTSAEKKYEDENGICVEKCENSKTGYIYYNIDFGNKCQNNCLNKYIKGNTCVNSCVEDEINTSSSSINKFLDENMCVTSCPITKRFVIYNQNEENTENNPPHYKCLIDCPKNYTYYSIITNSEFTEPVYACKNNCPAYIINNDPNINARLCFDEGVCTDNNQYYIDGDNNNKQCLSQCPDDKPYYKSDNSQDIKCLTECPEDYAHLPDKFICEPISACETKKINYIKKECVKECPKKYKIFVKGDISYCIENCTDLDSTFTGVETLLLTNDERCVTSCNPDTEKQINNICDCIKLFYIDKSTQKKICLSNSISSCENYEDYPISIVGTKECSYYCDGILSLSGHQCYKDENYNCTENYETLITFNNGDKVCDCIEKYYYPHNENGKKEKECLKKGENCPSPFDFYDIETKECLKSCTDKLQFEKTCVSFCPDSTEQNENSNECKCKNKWYINKENNKVICLKNDCPEDYPLYISDKKECVSSCIGTGYNFYFNRECIINCSGKLEISTEGDSFAKKYAEKKCQCNNIWYYDEFSGNEECYVGAEKADCNSFSGSKFKYKIHSTNQCVSSCNDDFPYEFNNLCFKKCEQYSQDIMNPQTTSGKCICKELSEYDENNNNKDITNCLTLEFCKTNNNYSVVTDLRQCYKIINGKKCPNKYPVYLNGYCYNETTCPSNTKYNPYEQKCNCLYKWYNTTSEIVCLSNLGNCPPEYPLLVISTNECRNSHDISNYFIFNSRLFLTCPDNTTRKGDTYECICDNKTFWYEDYNKTLHCGVSECPKEFPYKIDGDSNKECIENCGEKYLYRGICYNDCPELTEKGIDNECILSPVNNKLTLDNLEQTITENLVELYKKSNTYNEYNSTTSQKIVTKDATVEFYGVNKKNKKNSKENIQSDLSYIDISGCIEKIYESNGMDYDDDIIILKFDVNIAPKNFLINPVEYKFVNSRTGQELDASVCEHNSIKISYPLHDLINRYDNRKNKKRNLEYMQLDLTSNNRDSLREKLDKGKEINEKYSDVDIFNLNDKIYSDICIAVEVDGKDLILQDRFNYFYPQMSLCENNCTYNHTDFVNERIYCDCSFKKEFDFKREYSSSFEVDTESIKNGQGSNININVIKCISNLKSKKSLSGNGGFIFLLIIIVIEFLLLLIIIFYGIGSLLNKLKSKMKKDDDSKEDYDIIELNVATTNSNNDKKEKEKEKETQRQLNAPPKKKKEYGMEFIPQEYVFLFFNQNEKGVIKKVERDGVPFKTNYNTRILLEKNKNINYNNIKSRGPFPPNQNVLVIVDNMNDSISDYIYDDDESEDKNNGIKNTENNKINNDKNKNNDSLKNKNHKKNDKNSKNKISEKFDQKPKKYTRNKVEYTISDYDPSDENYSELDFDEEENHEKGFIESIKKEQRLIKKNYETSAQNQKSSNFIIMLFTEIIDKIYITKILLFTRKFDILTLQLSIYILCHTLLLILLALFYDIKTIEKIWNEENYPGLGYYLLYGLIACIIVWIIYTIILCLWSNNDKIKDLLRIIHATKKYGINKERIINKKFNNLSWKIKFKVAVYTIIEFLLLAFCFVYFVTFCTVYTGTMNKVFKSYGIALIEVLIIKIIYGIVLAILRKVSLAKEKKTLYNVVLFMDTYLV